jgi:hypothetical protein
VIDKSDVIWDCAYIEELKCYRLVGTVGFRNVSCEFDHKEDLPEIEDLLIDWFNGRGESGVSVQFAYPKGV